MKFIKRIRSILSSYMVGANRLRHKAHLSVDTLKQRLRSGEDMLVLDVRTAKEFNGEHGHLDVALNIPVEQLRQRIHELDDYVHRPIAIVCHTDKRSIQAAKLLAKYGFADIHVISGGMTFWNDFGFPVER